MILNTAEQDIWNEHKDFFAPGGVPNEEAYRAYLKKYAELGQDAHVGFEQQQLMGVLLKQAPDNAVAEAFSLYYRQFRTGRNTVDFDTWLGEVSEHRANLIAVCLKETAPQLNFTQQVMVLRDVQKWFPGENIKDYAPAKLLKTKPSVVLKQFNPALADMPYLLAMSASLMRDNDPQSQALGDTIVRGCFIARYGMPLESDESVAAIPYHNCAVKYCSTEGFSMLERHGIHMEPEMLLQQVQLRYNAQSVMFDALAYPAMVLNDANASDESRTNAMAVLSGVMSFAEKEPSHAGFGPVVELAFTRIHSGLGTRDPDMSRRIEDLMATHMRLAIPHKYLSTRTYDNVLSVVARVSDKGDSLLPTLAQRVLDESADPIVLLQRITADVGTNIYNSGACTPLVRKAFFALLAPERIEEYLSGSLRTLFDDALPPKTQTSNLKRLFVSFAGYDWTNEQKDAFKQSSLASTAILLYLYMTSVGHAEHPESTHRDGLPFTQWTPLPFLKSMYPESMALWNQMTVGLLQMPTSQSDDSQRLQYQRVMGSMFQAFSQAFLADSPSLSIAQGIVESLGVNPLDYFMDAHKKAVPAMTLELPQDMFAFE